MSDFVFDYKRVLKDFKDNRDLHFKLSYSDSYKEAHTKMIADYKVFQKNQNKAVNYMVKEFELKKAATAAQHCLYSSTINNDFSQNTGFSGIARNRCIILSALVKSRLVVNRLQTPSGDALRVR